MITVMQQQDCVDNAVADVLRMLVPGFDWDIEAIAELREQALLVAERHSGAETDAAYPATEEVLDEDRR